MANRHTTQVLEVDISGYRQSLQPKGKPRILAEALSNAFDTKTTVVVASYEQHAGGYASLTVEDNDPDGFKKLKDAWTLFAASERREDPEARGRFGQGEKEIIAICTETSNCELWITSTTGEVVFRKTGRTENRSTTRTLGTKLVAHLRMTKAESAEFIELVHSIIPPEVVTFSFNDRVINRSQPVRVARETLDTVIWDADGNMKDTRRVTNVELFEAAGTAYIYELGMPVVEHDGKYHINIGQKVPLNATRDNVKPSYLRKVREIMLNATYDLLSAEDQKSTWVKAALPNASEEAITTHFHKVWGKNAVKFDPNNPEASKRAVDEGRKLVYGGSYDKDVWSRVADFDFIKPAGQVIQTSVPTSPDGIPPIPREEWTGPMNQVADYVQALSRHAIGYNCGVEYQTCGTGAKRVSASWSGTTMTFYLRHLGRAWPGNVDQEELDALVIHELTHHKADDHFTDLFIHEIAGIGARLRTCPARLADFR